MQVCSKCGETKELAQFSARRSKKQPWCKECNRANARRYYQENKARLVKDINKLRKSRMHASQQFITEYLVSNPCVDCGEADPVVLEFDHVRGQKKNVMSSLVAEGYSIRAIKDEIAKCDVVCANCHRRRTAHRGNFYKVRLTTA
jgi:hypothetical protein